MIDWTKWKLVPVEATPEMCHSAGTSTILAEAVYTAMLAAAPPAPVVEVTKATCAKVARANVDARLATAPDEILESVTAIEALAWLFRWQQVLGPTLGLVTREELARAVGAAFRDALQQRGCWQEYIDEAWMNSATRKALATPAAPQSPPPPGCSTASGS